MKYKTLKKEGFFVFGAAILCAHPAHASLKLSDFYIDLHEENRSDSIYASNLGKEIMYLKVTVVEVVNPGTAEEITRANVNPKELGLLVSPQRFVVAPGEEARIRLVALAKPAKDRFYKITAIPVAGKLQTKEQIGVKILVGYSAWAYVRPKGAAPSLTGRREGKTLILTNDGDTLAQMMAGKICPAVSPCEKIDPFRVLAGQQKTIELMHENAPVSFRITWGNEGKDIGF